MGNLMVKVERQSLIFNMKNEELAFLIDNIVSAPGVYLMFDKHGKIIYIGKAKNLKNRVSQYFTRPQVGKVAAMVKNITKFETIVTNSEKEAFILELKLIQTHYPRYNIMLKDDSHYPYIAVSKKGDPVVSIERKATNKNLTYFGPFPASQKAYQIVDLVNKIFKTKKCKGHSKTPCFYYHLHQCLGYCFKEVSAEEKEEVRRDVLTFLNGKDTKTLKHYEALMKKESNDLNFEKAQEYKEIVTAIKHIYGAQNVELKNKIDADVIAFSAIEDLIGLAIVSYRKGILLAQKFEAINAFGDINEQIVTLLGQYYEDKIVPPHLILGSTYIGDELSLFYDTKIIIPSQGQYLEILNRTYQNASEELTKHLLFHQQLSAENELLEKLGHLLKIPYPRHIDLVDIAHLSGSEAIGVVITYINGRPFKKLYRKYNITADNKFDDYNNMREVLTRHYNRKLKEEKNLPDLLIIDGGKGQLSIAKEVITSLNLNINYAGLVKNDKHQTRGLISETEEYNVTREVLTLLASMQEEVHRFAITSHRHKRGKATYQSMLDGIKGLGKKRQLILLKTYLSVDALRSVSLEELSQIIPRDVAINLLAKLNEEI